MKRILGLELGHIGCLELYILGQDIKPRSFLQSFTHSFTHSSSSFQHLLHVSCVLGTMLDTEDVKIKITFSLRSSYTIGKIKKMMIGVMSVRDNHL